MTTNGSETITRTRRWRGPGYLSAVSRHVHLEVVVGVAKLRLMVPPGHSPARWTNPLSRGMVWEGLEGIIFQNGLNLWVIWDRFYRNVASWRMTPCRPYSRLDSVLSRNVWRGGRCFFVDK